LHKISEWHGRSIHSEVILPEGPFVDKNFALLL
jgi:hypothetical protein